MDVKVNYSESKFGSIKVDKELIEIFAFAITESNRAVLLNEPSS